MTTDDLAGALAAIRASRPDEAGQRDDGAAQAPLRGKGATVRIFAILETLAQSESQSLTQIATATDLPHPTVLRFLRELGEIGIVERDAQRRYRIGSRLFEIGMQAPFQRTLRRVALPIMEDIYEATHENVHLGILDGVSTLIIQQIAGRGSVLTAGGSGVRLPAYATANGKALIAFSGPQVLEEVIADGLRPLTSNTITSASRLRREIAQIRDQGYARAREEASYGTESIAAPVLDFDQSVIASISVVLHSSRESTKSYAPMLRVAATAVSRRWMMRDAR